MKTNLDKAAVYLAECRAMGIQVLTPDMNLLARRLRPAAVPRCRRGGAPVGSPGAITFGLSAVRNVGEGLVELLVRGARTSTARSQSFYDFAERVPRTGAQQARRSSR